MTDQPGWASPGHRDPDPGQPPSVGPRWAAQQPPPSWGQPGRAPPPAPPGWGGPPPGWTPTPKPGVIPLRPLGVGEILDGAISTIRSRPRVMLGLSALVAAASQLLIVPVTWLLLRDSPELSFSAEPGSTEDELAYQAGALSAAAVQIVVTLLATLVLTGILTVVLSRAVLGQGTTAGEAWAKARPRLPALIGVTVLVGLVELGVFAVALGPGLLLAATGAPGAAVAVTLVIGIPVAVAAAVYLYVAFALAPASIVLEKRSVVASLRRSRALVTGAWWRTFAILLLVNVIAQFISAILSVPFLVLQMVAALVAGGSDALDLYSIVPLLVAAVGTIVAATVTWPFTAVSTALLYVDRRIRREALDLELVRAAGLAPPGQSATPGAAPDASYGSGPGR
ncbi:MAG: hypothetical protein ACRDV1_11180 [Actinomycetes bacterium]